MAVRVVDIRDYEVKTKRLTIPESKRPKKWRRYQYEAIEAALEAYESYRFVLFEGPPGTGKSIVAMSLAIQEAEGGGSTYIVTATKQLQKQYSEQFVEEVTTVKGRSNFTCMQGGGFYCDEGKCRTEKRFSCDFSPKKEDDFPVGLDIDPSQFAAVSHKRGLLLWPDELKKCIYWDQKVGAMNAPIVVQNYSYLLAELNYISDFGPRDLLICDEGHNVERQVMSFSEYSFTRDTIDYVDTYLEAKKRGMSITQYESLKGAVIDAGRAMSATLRVKSALEPEEWASCLGRLAAVYAYVSEDVVSADVSERYDRNRKKCERISMLLIGDPENWVVDSRRDGSGSPRRDRVMFKPIEVSNYTGNLMFSHGEKKLLMSATILDAETICEMLGIDEAVFIQTPSIFPTENRPIFMDFVGSMTRKYSDATMPVLIDKIASIMDAYPRSKGIVHTVNYEIQSNIENNLFRGYGERLVVPRNAAEREMRINQLVSSDDPKVLVSPSFEEGLDYSGFGFSIICKIPYIGLGELHVRKKMEKFPRWFQLSALLRLVQAYGRGVRSETDSCDTYILDTKFFDFFNSNNRSFPIYFKEAMELGTIIMEDRARGEIISPIT